MSSFPIVGARFRPPAQEVLDNLPAGTKLLLRRQPDNPFDGNAVQVILTWDDPQGELGGAAAAIIHATEADYPLHLGFIPREAAANLAPKMDEWYDDQEDSPEFCEWPATLTFAAHGGPMASFEEPQI